MNHPRIREINLDEDEETLKDEVCFADPEDAECMLFKPYIFVYSFTYHSSAAIRDGFMIGRFRTFEAENEQSKINEKFCAFVFQADKFFATAMPGQNKVTVNKKELKVLEEVPINVGDLIEIGGLGKFVIVDKENVDEEEAKSYVGRRLVNSTVKQNAVSLDAVDQEVAAAQEKVTEKSNILNDFLNQLKKLEYAKEEIIKLQRLVKQLESLKLPEKINVARSDFEASEAELANKKRALEVLTKKMNEHKEREKQRAIEEKAELERQILELRQKHKEIEKKIKK
ncbi:MAG: hypothetical protein HQK49_11650 [Oligoflexia bacterium]|nr:hypothetical protein [Oligoflexia bacterium]